MPHRFYTIFVLPHARARFRKVHVSRNFVVVMAGVLAILVGSTIALPHLVFKAYAQTEALARVGEENRKLLEERKRLDASLKEVEQIRERLQDYEDRANELAVALNLEKLPSSEPATGGAAPADFPADDLPAMLNEEVEALTSRAGTLDISFEQLHQVWEERTRLLASTPSLMPVRGWFSHGYGWRIGPFTGQREFHRGIDLVAPAGTPVKATAEGVVTKAGREGGYGKAVKISHGYGFATLYGHLNEVLVRPGQRVRRGDLIGRVGSTGRSTGPHLHYEIFKEGRAINPWKYLGDKLF